MSRPAERVDVLVLGLGPAGAAAAAEAARRGCRVVALDRKHEAGRPVQCAELVPAMIGIEVGALAASVRQPIASMRTFIEDDAPDLTAHFPGQMLDRAAFDAALLAEAADAGAVCRLGVRAMSVGPKGVTLADGVAITADVIVGADGPRSLAGRAIGQVNTALVETRQVSVPLLRKHDATDIFLSAGIPGGYAWLFPKRDVANLGAGVRPSDRARLKGIVARLHARLATEGWVGREVLALTGGAIPVGGMLHPYGGSGDALVLLAGDAAGLTNPVTGAGILPAVVSGRLAGQAAAAHLAGDRDAAREYAEELEDRFGASIARALERRRELDELHAASRIPGRPDLMRGWIAYPEYWTNAPRRVLENVQ